MDATTAADPAGGLGRFWVVRHARRILVGGLVLALAELLWKVSEWQADRATDITAPRDRIALENELRRTMATVIAGAFVLVSGFLAWLKSGSPRTTTGSAKRT